MINRVIIAPVGLDLLISHPRGKTPVNTEEMVPVIVIIQAFVVEAR